MKKKLLITGIDGLLGSSLKKTFEKKYTILGCSREELDITDKKRVKQFIEDNTPDIIIHTAAFTNVEACQTERGKAFSINTIGTKNLVDPCIGSKILFVYISSTGIYGRGLEAEYTEFDSAQPTTIHHKSKYEAEKIVMNHLSRFLILRTGWLYGGSIKCAKNFVYKRYLEAKGTQKTLGDNSQKGNPTYVKNVAGQLDYLIDNSIYGLYNCVDRGCATRFEYVQKIIELFGLDCTVEIAPPGHFKRIAPVSPNESAVNYKLDLEGINTMKAWQESLEEYITQLKEEINA